MRTALRHRWTARGVWGAIAAMLLGAVTASDAHPLGKFTISHYTRLSIGAERIRLRYVVDLAEIATFQELERIDADGDRVPSAEEKEAYLRHVAPQYSENLLLAVDGQRVPLSIETRRLSLRAGDGGLPTLRVECDLLGVLPPGAAIRRLRFEDANRHERSGWREIVVQPMTGITVFDCNGFGDGVTNELQSYPEGDSMRMLDERSVELSYLAGVAAPAGAQPLRMRDGSRGENNSRDRLAELIAVPELNLRVMLWGLLLAALLGALHAMSPGHGKTVVGAYLVGSRGTARHAVFLGLTVTHTAGVFALGLMTLAGSQYLMPEKLYAWLSIAAGGLIASIGLSQIALRTRSWLRSRAGEGRPGPHRHNWWHTHSHDDGEPSHDHGPHGHSHAPPARVTWRSLLALGVSGGLLPCPSALVVLLAAISLHRIGYGLLLVLAFSAGLAGALTLVGLLFIYARRLLRRPLRPAAGRLTNALPAISAGIIFAIGLLLFLQGLSQAGIPVAAAAKLGAARMLFS